MKKISIFLGVIGCLSLIGAELYVDQEIGSVGGNGSSEKPYKTITHALKFAKDGDVVKVGKGTYREPLFLRSKTFSSAVTIEGNTESTPVISGFDIVSNWEEVSPKLFKSTIKYVPFTVRLKDKVQPISRYPEEGWQKLNLKGENTFEGFADKVDVSGSLCYVWTNTNNIFWTFPVTNFDATKNTIQVTPNNKWAKIIDNDRFFCYNKRSFITKNGQWCYEKSASGYDLFIMADSADDLKETEVAGGRVTLDFTQVENMKLKNLIFEGSVRNGITLIKSKNIDFDRVDTYLNKDTGIYLRDSSNLKVTNSNVALNLMGIVLYNSSDVEIKNSDVGYNFEDGFNICWGSKNVLLDGNYIHHHTWWGHPDNVQLFRDTENVTLKNNLLFSAFQGFMSETAKNLHFENNYFIGVCANLLILGHKNVDDVTVKNNSLFHPGYASGYLTGKNYKFSNNIVEGGFGCYAMYGYDANSNYVGENNIFVNNEHKSMIAMYGKEICRDLTTYQNLSQTDKNSQAGKFNFASAPKTFAVIDMNNIYDCEKNKVFLRTEPIDFAVDDSIEINFDGVMRKITAIEGKAITFEPALPYKPLKNYTVANWKQQTKPVFDYSCAEISNVGANLNIENFRVCDFDGDGKQNTLQLPEYVKDFIVNIDSVIVPKNR